MQTALLAGKEGRELNERESAAMEAYAVAMEEECRKAGFRSWAECRRLVGDEG